MPEGGFHRVRVPSGFLGGHWFGWGRFCCLSCFLSFSLFRLGSKAFVSPFPLCFNFVVTPILAIFLSCCFEIWVLLFLLLRFFFQFSIFMCLLESLFSVSSCNSLFISFPSSGKTRCHFILVYKFPHRLFPFFGRQHLSLASRPSKKIKKYSRSSSFPSSNNPSFSFSSTVSGNNSVPSVFL